ncbi:MAG: M15 family metallopeptidase [Clostridia bacterium]|nr:M15 family metallopeptidase [Clostridia bacterium]
MRLTKYIICVLLSCVLTVSFAGCGDGSPAVTLPGDILLKPEQTSSPSGTDVPKDTEGVKEPEYSYVINIGEYLQYIAPDNDAQFAVLVNKQNEVGRDFAPENSVTLDKSLTLYGWDISLEAYTAKALEAMLAEMKACGYKNVYVSSGYRSFDYQSILYNTYFANEKEKHPDWSNEQIKAEVLTYSAYPGTSEHQTGLCLDLFISPEMTELVNYGSETSNASDIGFAESEEYQWLLENAHKFGFILRFGKGKEALTGYSYESWHYRFVGRKVATYIYEHGLCYEEYLNGVGG